VPSYRRTELTPPEPPAERYLWNEDRDDAVTIWAERARDGAPWEFWECSGNADEWQPVPSTEKLVRAAMKAVSAARK
jgi:hypothetical protein